MELHQAMMCCLFNYGSRNTCFSDACNSAIFLSNPNKELTRSPEQININVHADNQSLFKSLKTTKQTLDYHFRVEVSALGEMCINNKISNQLSDPHKERRTSHQKLMQVSQSDYLPMM